MAALAVASASTARAGVSGAVPPNPVGSNAVTISLSGSTAMSNFTRSAGFSLLYPEADVTTIPAPSGGPAYGGIILLSGPGGAPVRYKASAASTGVQLARQVFDAGATANPSS